MFKRAVAAIAPLIAQAATPAQASQPLVIYTSTYKEVISEYQPGLQKFMGSTPVSWFQAGSESISAKIQTEEAAGSIQADILMTSDPFFYLELKKKGLLAEIPKGTAHLNQWPQQVIDSDRQMIVNRFPMMAIAYNSKLIRASDAPKSFQELTDSKWASKVSMPSPLESGTTLVSCMFLWKLLGESFFRNLGANSVQSAGGNGAVLSRIQSGEKPVGIVLMENVLMAKRKGIDTVNFVVPDEGVIPIPSPIAIFKSSKNQEAAFKALSWFLDARNAPLLVRGLYYSSNPDHPAPLGAPDFKSIKTMSWSYDLLQEWATQRLELKALFSKSVLSANGSSNAVAWPRVIANTVFYVLAITLFTVLLGLPLAFLFANYQFYGSRSLAALLASSYIIPSYLFAMAWITLANPAVGWLNLAAGTPWINIYGFWGAVWVEGLALLSVMFVGLRSGFDRIDSSLEEAAALCGAKSHQIWAHITWPLLRPALVWSALTVALAALASYGVPAMIANPDKTFFMTTALVSLVRQGGAESMRTALWASLALVAVVSVAIFGLQKILSSQKKSSLGRLAKPRSPRSERWMGQMWGAVIWIFWACAMGMPAVVLIVSSFQPDPLQLTKFSTKAWVFVFSGLPGFAHALQVSVLSALLAGAIILVVSTALSLFKWQTESKRQYKRAAVVRTLESLFLALNSMPGTILALWLLFALLALRGSWLQNSVWILAIAYSLKYMSVGISLIQPSVMATHPSLVEAALLFGADLFERLKRLWIPMLKWSLWSALFLVLMPCVAELSMTTLLNGPKTQNLGVLLFDLQEYSDRASASVIGSVILLFMTALQLAKERIKPYGR